MLRLASWSTIFCMPQEAIDQAHMREALQLARLAAAEGEVPVGALIVQGDIIIGRGRNRRERRQDPLAHAEVEAIREAVAHTGSWRLIDATCYVTLEPCPMCAGALVNARVARLVYGAADPKAGAVRTLYEIGQDTRLNHRFSLTEGVLAEECGQLLTDFFRAIRAGRKLKT